LAGREDRSAGGLTTIKIQVKDAAIALDDVGEGPPVLLLHGFPATRYLWSRAVPSRELSSGSMRCA